MKKFLSLVLAAMMLLSCTSAFAAYPALDATNGVFDVRETDDRYTGKDKLVGTATTGPRTEVWLQVEANGQIDVTVPLVLVFKTDIDGGSAQSPDTYKITNNGTTDIAITDITATVVQKNSETQPMDLTTYSSAAITAEDTYALKLSADAKDPDSTNHRVAHAAFAWDISETLEHADAAKGGHFQVYKKADTRVYADMKTGPMSFVTKTMANGTADQVIDPAQGVKLVTIAYTVAVDAQNAIGENITVTEKTTGLGYTLTEME